MTVIELDGDSFDLLIKIQELLREGKTEEAQALIDEILKAEQ